MCCRSAPVGPIEHLAGKRDHRFGERSFFAQADWLGPIRLGIEVAQQVLAELLVELTDLGHQHAVLVADVIWWWELLPDGLEHHIEGVEEFVARYERC
jgi:hypothetical protein